MARIVSTTSNGVDAFPAPPPAEMTIDALMARQREIAAERARIQPGNIASPMQGFAYLGNILANKLNQGRADRQLAEERDVLAQLAGGINWEEGPTGAQISAAMSRDEDFGRSLVEAARDAVLARRRRQETLADTAETRAYNERIDRDKYLRERGDLAADRVTKNADEAAIDARELGQEQDRIKAEQEAAAAEVARKAEAGKQTVITGDEAIKLGHTGAVPGRQYKVTADGTGIEDVTPTTPETWRDLTPEEQAKYPGGQQISTTTGKVSFPSATTVQKPLSTKDLLTERENYITFDTGVRQLQRAVELLGQGIDTGLLAGARTETANVPVLGTLLGADPDTADRTRQFNDIMNSQAIQVMAQTLKGASTEKEMANFMQQMNNPRLSPPQKQEMLVEFLLGPAMSRKDLTEQTILESGGQVPTIADPGVLPLGVSEEDVQETMRANGMTREQVLERLKKGGS